MFGVLTNLAKAAVAVAATPVALAADIVTLPASASSIHGGPFDRTASMLTAAGECVKEAVDTSKS